MDQHTLARQAWVRQALSVTQPLRFETIAGDASTRRYWRIHGAKCALILMDCPEAQTFADFESVTQLFTKIGVHVPSIFAMEREQGWMLISDLGNELYFDKLTPEVATQLYTAAFGSLIKWQHYQGPECQQLPIMGANYLQDKLDVFNDWFVAAFLQQDPTEWQPLWQAFWPQIEAVFEPASFVIVHLDYHSRNLLYCGQTPGIIDYQDAHLGPCAYDLASLLNDAYITWPETQVIAWQRRYWNMATNAGLNLPTFEVFVEQFDWCALQRHLKNLGVFARLHLRDGKSGYVKEIPRLIGYIERIARRRPNLTGLVEALADVTVNA